MDWIAEIFYATITAASLVLALRRDRNRGAAVSCMALAWLMEGAVYVLRPAMAGNYGALISECTMLTVFAAFPVMRRTAWGRFTLAYLLCEIVTHVAYRNGMIHPHDYHLILNVFYVMRMFTPSLL